MFHENWEKLLAPTYSIFFWVPKYSANVPSHGNYAALGGWQCLMRMEGRGMLPLSEFLTS
jgi:hypothetical protein